MHKPLYVISADGTKIGYRKLGNGPGLIIVNGGMRASEHYLHLAKILGHAFTVYLPDRRGRSLSGAGGAHYGMATELQDMQALLEVTGAEYIMGHSAGGLVALEAARTIPQIKKMIVYEPPFAIDHNISTASWVPQFDEEIKRHKYAAAMATALAGLGLLPPEAMQLPRAMRVMIMRILLLTDWRSYLLPGRTRPGALVASQKLDLPLVDYMDSKMPNFKSFTKPALLLGGDKTSTPFLIEALKELSHTMPHASLHMFPGLEHTAPTTPKGAAQIAPVVQEFLSSK